MTFSTGTGAMRCMYCGKPAFSMVWIGGQGYHEECTRAPVFQGQAPSMPMLFGITEDRVRQIVREELKARETP